MPKVSELQLRVNLSLCSPPPHSWWHLNARLRGHSLREVFGKASTLPEDLLGGGKGWEAGGGFLEGLWSQHHQPALLQLPWAELGGRETAVPFPTGITTPAKRGCAGTRGRTGLLPTPHPCQGARVAQVRGELRQEEKHLLWESFWRLEPWASGWEEGRTKSQGCDKCPFSPKPGQGASEAGETRLSRVSWEVESDGHTKHSPAPSWKQWSSVQARSVILSKTTPNHPRQNDPKTLKALQMKEPTTQNRPI